MGLTSATETLSMKSQEEGTQIKTKCGDQDPQSGCTDRKDCNTTEFIHSDRKEL